MIENEGYKNRIIAVEVALKAAIELVKSKDIKLEHLEAHTNQYFNMILSIADAKVEDTKIYYLEDLLRNSTLDEPHKVEVEKEIEHNMAYERYYQLRDMLKDNQLGFRDGNFGNRAMNKHIDEKMANDKA